jgi:uncharacterized repeat protein (TIGR01451 family)
MSRAAARRTAIVTALVVGAGVVVSAGLGGTASGGLRAQKAAPFAPSRLAVVRVSIGMRVVPRTAKQGQTVTYLLRVSNTGDDPARALRICNRVPQGLTLVSRPPHFALGRGGLVCRTLTSLPIGGTAIGNFRMKVSPSAKAGVVVNTASARAPGMARSVTAQAQLRIVGPCPSRLAVPLC